MDQTDTPIEGDIVQSELRDLALSVAVPHSSEFGISLDRVIISAMAKVTPTSTARLAAVDAAQTCRSLLNDLRQARQQKDLQFDPYSEAREQAAEAIMRLENELAACPPPPLPDKTGRRVLPRSSSVVMKKRRATYNRPEPEQQVEQTA